MEQLGFKSSAGRAAWRTGLAMAALAVGLTWACGAAQAADVYWSVGVQSPGMMVGVANWAPPPPVYAVPAPVVVYQQPRLLPPPPPVYQLGWAPPGHRHHHHHHWRDDDGWRDAPRFAPQGN